MTTTRADEFRALHVPGEPLLMPNPWDLGSARLLEHLGFRALATTSSGFAFTLGRPDGSLGRDEALAHAAALAGAVGVPVSADLEDCYAADLDGVAATVGAARSAGLAGCSIEDWDGRAVYDLIEATDRVRAAVQAAAGQLVVTARAENHIRDRHDLADTVARLQAYRGAGADVLYAPGLTGLGDIRTVVAELDRPVNVLVVPGGPTVPELADAGVARVSVGGAFAFAAVDAVVAAARELQAGGTGYTARSRAGSAAARAALAPPA